ncbi:hypothetical protein FRD01_15310 [Microvenator marinus]|uniref:Uncharacterized protein n=1 Tax=Microvenator marinus TaxID=2600177 RepID=A0A5B8XY46_9DELT|nr:hypothetical protein [Microvenator marinus]QED28576.1 hypothetical protein FRD01_15310 [Microvenator marinus]
MAPPEEPEIEVEGEFFDPEALLTEESTSLSGWESVSCAGAAEAEQKAEDSPVLLRGEMFPGRADLEVVLARATPDFEIEETLLTTKTDGLGRFCLKFFPHDPGPDLMLVVNSDPRLRRLVLDPKEVNIGAQHEAIVQLIKEHPIKRDTATLMNFHTMAYTALDLLFPITGADEVQELSVEQVESAKERIQKDERARAQLARN